MTYIDTTEKKKRIQEALNEKLDLDPRLAVDGYLGSQSVAAIIKARSVFNLDRVGEPVVDTDLMRELGLLTIQSAPVVDAAAAGGIDLFGILKLISTIQAISKGKLMDGSKPWYASQTIWASILTGVSALLAIFHVNFGAADQAAAVEIILQVITVGGAIWTAIGRFRATKAIG